MSDSIYNESMYITPAEITELSTKITSKRNHETLFSPIRGFVYIFNNSTRFVVVP